MNAMESSWFADHYVHIQIALGIGLLAFWIRKQLVESSESRFKVREADRKIQWERGEKAKLSGAQTAKKSPLQLSGISLQGAPHEVLGVPALASEAEIQKAYKELIKRYHPDKIGPPGSREWQDAQKIAEVINQARTEMLDRLKSRRP